MLFFDSDPMDSIKKTLHWLTKGKWIFEGNVMVYPIHCLQTSNSYLLTIISYMILVNEALLSYCSAPPTILWCSWTIWRLNSIYFWASKNIGWSFANWLHQRLCCIDSKSHLEHTFGIWKKINKHVSKPLKHGNNMVKNISKQCKSCLMKLNE
jgi:hypothetical protein